MKHLLNECEVGRHAQEFYMAWLIDSLNLDKGQQIGMVNYYTEDAERYKDEALRDYVGVKSILISTDRQSLA